MNGERICNTVITRRFRHFIVRVVDRAPGKVLYNGAKPNLQFCRSIKQSTRMIPQNDMNAVAILNICLKHRTLFRPKRWNFAQSRFLPLFSLLCLGK